MTRPPAPLRALVVDDSVVVRGLIGVNLELEGFEVRTAEDGLEALEVLETWLPDVITVDVMMPRLGGFDLIARLRADPRTATLPVVVVTGRAQATDRDLGLRLGADDYVSKPFEPGDLVETVTRLARHGRTPISE
ncbi:MAG: response regulator [Nocardioidaceae bacterium]|nr:response regulator [Nocardioidaceae bacterium]NUS51753.1 response regulator [Nocardioidaceae bacterium]